ncbi:hypothetical protein PEPS_10240 [Persicobacter psychrovividus]|uniref:Uncharacterized protein n=1 Tax=Persicobacter psychrovividus TaxID=387638 RepID=A0ABM7VCS7_9BACT|nr:hypothetical protein PEPS_10240 [Persicobacter psychrovividus]
MLDVSYTRLTYTCKVKLRNKIKETNCREKYFQVKIKFLGNNNHVSAKKLNITLKKAVNFIKMIITKTRVMLVSRSKVYILHV